MNLATDPCFVTKISKGVAYLLNELAWQQEYCYFYLTLYLIKSQIATSYVIAYTA
jgi:hypothetical protein